MSEGGEQKRRRGGNKIPRAELELRLDAIEVRLAGFTPTAQLVEWAMENFEVPRSTAYRYIRKVGERFKQRAERDKPERRQQLIRALEVGARGAASSKHWAAYHRIIREIAALEGLQTSDDLGQMGRTGGVLVVGQRIDSPEDWARVAGAGVVEREAEEEGDGL